MFLRPSHFCDINSTFIGNSHYKSFCHNSFEPTQIFIRWPCHILSAEVQTNRWWKNQMQSELKLSERTKVYYCFNSGKGAISTWSNFNILPKTITKCRWRKFWQYTDDDFKTTRLNSWSAQDFVWKCCFCVFRESTGSTVPYLSWID